MNWERVESVRWWARSLLVIAGILIVTPVFLWVSAPRFIGGMDTDRTAADILISDLPTVIGFAGMFFGLAWMWRIYRAPTKSDGALWRYRDR